MGIRRILLLMDLLRIRRGVPSRVRRGLLPLPRKIQALLRLKKAQVLPIRVHQNRRRVLLPLLLLRRDLLLLPKGMNSMKKQSLDEAVFFIPRKDSVGFLLPFLLSTLIFYLRFPIADRMMPRDVFYFA